MTIEQLCWKINVQSVVIYHVSYKNILGEPWAPHFENRYEQTYQDIAQCLKITKNISFEFLRSKLQKNLIWISRLKLQKKYISFEFRT